MFCTWAKRTELDGQVLPAIITDGQLIEKDLFTVCTQGEIIH